MQKKISGGAVRKSENAKKIFGYKNQFAYIIYVSMST